MNEKQQRIDEIKQKLDAYEKKVQSDLNELKSWVEPATLHQRVKDTLRKWGRERPGLIFSLLGVGAGVLLLRWLFPSRVVYSSTPESTEVTLKSQKPSLIKEVVRAVIKNVAIMLLQRVLYRYLKPAFDKQPADALQQTTHASDDGRSGQNEKAHSGDSAPSSPRIDPPPSMPGVSP